MNISDRIQHLRKTKGISREELADKIGVSRQAVSKWESEQSTPDIEKIILLSDYFETTTDFLLKGIEPVQELEKKCGAAVFSIVGTVLNAIGLAASIVIWIERQTVYAVGIGLAVILLGTGIFLIGQFIDTGDKPRQNGFSCCPMYGSYCSFRCLAVLISLTECREAFGDGLRRFLCQETLSERSYATG